MTHFAPMVPADRVHSSEQQRDLPSADLRLPVRLRLPARLMSDIFVPSGSHHYAPYIYRQKRWLLVPFFKSTERTRND